MQDTAPIGNEQLHGVGANIQIVRLQIEIKN
jgi:hypothetical protein